MVETITENETLIVRLKSTYSEVDAKAVALVMIAFLDLLEDAQGKSKDDERLEIRAKAFDKGSFVIPFDLVSTTAVSLIPYQSQIEFILTSIKTYLEIRRLRSDSKVKAIEEPRNNITINQSNSGPTINIVLNASHVTEKDLGKAFDALDREERVDGVEVIKGSTGELLNDISREEFGNFTSSDEGEDGPGERNIQSHESLVVVAPVLSGRAFWRFRLKGRLLSAKITDEEFLERVRSRKERFAAGDRMVVNMTTHQKFDEELQAYVNKSTTITKVISHQKNPRQTEFSDGI